MGDAIAFCYILVLGHNGTGTQWVWDTTGLVHNGTGIQRDRYTMVLGHNGTGTQ